MNLNQIKGSKNSTKRVAIYTRVSTTEQADEGYSIDEQERLARDYCDKKGWLIYRCYSDKGISGKNITARPGVQQLIKEAKESKFDIILVWKFNRLARNTLDLLQMLQEVDRYNISFKSLTEDIDTSTPTGMMLLQFVASLGQYERANIAQNVKMGMLARAKEGRWNGGRVLGYDNVVVEETVKNGKKKEDVVLQINLVEAEIVKQIFKMYVEGKGYKAIANQLNKEGKKTKKGNEFSTIGVREILMNPVYIGMIRYNLRQNWSEKRRRDINPDPIMVEGIHDPIIDIDTWEKAKIRMQQTQGKPSRLYDGEYPLTGILKCPVCGAGMVISRTTNRLKDGTKKQMVYYVCGAWKSKGTRVCNSNGIRANEANEYVFGKLGELLGKDEVIRHLVQAVNKERKENINPAKKELDKKEKELQKLEVKKRRLFESYEEEIIEKKDFAERMGQIKEEENNLVASIEELTSKVWDGGKEAVTMEEVKSVFNSFTSVMKECGTREQQKKLLHMLLSKITIGENRKIEEMQISVNESLIQYMQKVGVSIIGTPTFIFKYKVLSLY